LRSALRRCVADEFVWKAVCTVLRKGQHDEYSRMLHRICYCGAKNMPASSAAIEELQLEAKNRLHGLSGSTFDHEFVSLMTAEQQEAVPIFNSAAASDFPCS
jgi:hypothetical protein